MPLFYSLFFVAFLSPALFRGNLLAVGADGQNLYLPNYYSAKVLWDPLLFTGFPMKADPQVMSWYPPAMLLSQLPGTWNIFILLAYVLASSFTFGYIYTLTGRWQAALVSGLIYSLSGFMMAHLGHAVIVHVVAWLPLIIWSFEKLRKGWSAAWASAASAAIALSFLGGHTQVFGYGLILSLAYAAVLGWTASPNRWRYYATIVGIVILGLGLVAIQIIPTAEVAAHSVRVGYSFPEFVSYSLPPQHLLLKVFPWIFGAQLNDSSWPQYFGLYNQTELTGYVGLLPLMLAVIGFIKWPERRLAIFWLLAAVVSILLAMGDATPLAALIYRIPVLNQFRAPGRHLLEWTLAITVLAGLGINRIMDDRPKRLGFIVVALSGFILITCAVIAFLNINMFVALAAEKEIPQTVVVPWIRSAVAIPFAIFICGGSVLLYWTTKGTSFWRYALLLVVLVLDLASFGWFYQWRNSPLNQSELVAPPIALRYKELLKNTNERILPARGTFAALTEMPPNLSRYWGIPSASGYNSLILMRISHVLSMTDVGDVTRPFWLEPNDQSLNLASVRYLFLDHAQKTSEHETAWKNENMQLWFGAGCNEPPRSNATLQLPLPVRATEIGIVSRLACSSHIPNDSEVARIRLTGSDGQSETRSLLAGRDASEWAYDCSSVTPHMKHQKALVFKSYPATMYDQPCSGNFYVTKWKLDQVRDIAKIDVEWVSSSGALILEKISLIDSELKTAYQVDPITTSQKWRLVESTETASVYENLFTLPRAWMVSEVVTLSPVELLAAVRTSKLPDGRSFEPRKMALVEENIPGWTSGSSGTANVLRMSESQMEVRTSSPNPNLLVTSDAYYPGWRATVDGKETTILRTNYAFRAIVLPAGDHVVLFEYRPRSFYLGLAITSVFLLCLMALSWRALFPRKSI